MIHEVVLINIFIRNTLDLITISVFKREFCQALKTTFTSLLMPQF